MIESDGGAGRPRSRRRVVITGMGALSPVGNTAPDTWQALLEGRSGAGPVTAFDAAPFPTRIAAEVKGFTPADFIDGKEAKRMARFSQLAVVAAREAVCDAGIEWAREDGERAAVVLGTGFGGYDLVTEPIGKWYTTGTVRVTPHQALENLSNMAAFHVGLENGCLGPLSTIVTACAAATQALGEGAELIRRDAADIVLSGGTEAQVTPLLFAGFCALRNMTIRNDEPERASRPFEAKRDGFLLGEGAGVMVLEEREHALRRGARIYAELLGYGASADAYHIAQPEATGLGPARAMRWALQDAGIAPEQVNYINAHGTATVQNDPAETAAIKRVFGDHAYRLVVNSTKSMIGHCIGAAGALEGLATVMAVHTDAVHPTINLDEPDPACDLDYVPHRPRHLPVEIAISNSFGLGGQNACIVVGKHYDRS